MTGKPPPRNLPPDSERWGRWVEDNLHGLRQSDTETTQGVNNTLAGLNGALGQLSGQISDLARVVASLPVSLFQTGFAEGFAAPNGFANIASTTFVIPAGKTNCSIMATYQGFYDASGSSDASRAAFRVTTSTGYVGPWGVMSPDNMDHYWLTGSGGVQVGNVSGPITVNIQSSAGTPLAPASTTNRIDLFALAIFS